MSLNDLPSEIICIITDDLDDPTVINLSLTCSFLNNTLKHIIDNRRKIKSICDTLSNYGLKKFLKDTPKNNTVKDLKVYNFVLQNREKKGILYDKKNYKNGHRMCEKWFLNGEYHRPTSKGPARIEYRENGQRDYEVWYLNGKEHRPTSEGPAVIEYNKNGQIKHEFFYENGNRVGCIIL